MSDAATLPAEFRSADYWRERYRGGGNSGAGAGGRLAVYKAHIVNVTCETRRIRSVVEFGSGDGSQATLFHVPQYLGVDVSPEALEIARARLEGRTNFRLKALDAFKAEPETADLSVSLDVIYHLVEDAVFEDYMERLFAAARKFVLIYSSDHDAEATVPHVRHRRYSTWIERHAPHWRLARTLEQPFPYREGATNPRTTSFAFFRLFRRVEPQKPA